MKESFPQFMKRIDCILEQGFSLYALDLPDFHYRDNYNAGISASITAKEALSNADYPG